MANYVEVEISKFNQILDRLGDAEMIDLSRFDLIIHGKGGQTKEFYAKLRKDKDVEVLITGTAGSGWGRFLSSFFPWEKGLVKILKASRLKLLFQQLGTSSITELFYVPKEITKQIIKGIADQDPDIAETLDGVSEYVYVKAQLDDYVQHEAEYYYLYDYRLGNETAAVIRTVFNGL